MGLTEGLLVFFSSLPLYANQTLSTLLDKLAENELTHPFSGPELVVTHDDRVYIADG